MYYGVLIFILISLSGDCISALHGKRFGEITPVTILGIGFLMYICGCFEILFPGLVLVLAITVSIYGYCLGYLIIKKKWKEFLKNFFTRTFFLFAMVCILFFWGDNKQQTISADDLGHWMDCVKSMVYSGKFYTADTFSVSTFPTYPPFFGLIQYVVQAVRVKILNGAFNEGLMLFVLHSVIVMLCLPIIATVERNKGKWPGVITSMISVVLMTTVLFPLIVNRTMVDPLLAVAAAVMFALIAEKKQINHSSLYIGLLIPALVLMKDIGLLFSVFGLILLGAFSISERKYRLFTVSALGTMIAKGSWAMMIARYNAVDAKPASVDWMRYIKALFGLASYEEEYKNIAVANYRSSLFEQKFELNLRLINVSMPYWLCIVLVLMGYWFFVRYQERRCEDNPVGEKNYIYRRNLLVMIGLLIVFWFGLGGIYIDKFIQQEALSLASYDRYYNTVIGIVFFELILLLLMNFHQWKNKKLVFLLPVFLFMIFPIDYNISYVKREYYRYANRKRADANRFAQEMTEICEPDSHVYLVSQSSSGWWDYLVDKFMIRPYLAFQPISGDEYNWFFVEEKKTEDIYSVRMDRATWEELLFDSGTYDYVAIAEVDDYFLKEFSSLFDTESITARSIYKVDTENRCLVLLYKEN